MSEMKSLTLNDKTYDGFVDPVARALAAATAVIKSASGESISLSDSGGNQLYGLNIYGRTIQDGTPTPDSPVELESAGDQGGITVTITGEKQSQDMFIETPNGLPGIPVDSGGNYTDSNGQQWICDEIDFGRGVYVQRIGKKILDGVSKTVSINGYNKDIYLYYCMLDNNRGYPGYCTHFTHTTVYPQQANQGGTFSLTRTPTVAFFSGYGIVSGDNSTQANANEFNNWLKAQNEAGTPVTLLYAMATPIETPLSVEEMVAYSKLRTYRDHTTISNDAGAYMEMEYAMDTKKYIDSLAFSSSNAAARLSEVTVLASAWKGSDSLYSQVVTIDGITHYSKVDLLPSVEQLAIFHNKDVAFVTENEDGVVTVYAIGDKPTQDYTMQVSITEVIA